MVADYPAAHVIHRLGLAPQTWPDDLRKRADESPMAYSGRLFQEFMSPATLSPLNDLKGRYMEIANPFLSRSVVVASHTLPESLRRGRRAMRAVQSALQIDIPFAERSAPARLPALFAHPGFRDELHRGLSLPAAERIFSEEAVATLRRSPSQRPATALWTGLRPRLKKAVPDRVRGRIKARPQLTGTPDSLQLRAYIAVRMVELLTADATLLQPPSTIDAGRPVALREGGGRR
jgi:hypothetical protein